MKDWLWKNFEKYWALLRNQFNNRSVFTRVLLIAGLFITTAAFSYFLIFFMVWSGLLGSLPNVDELEKMENPNATEVYSADSVLLGKYFIQERSYLRYEQLPPHLIDALLTTEDVRFYDHHGVDYKSLWRVFFKSILLQHDASGGGSTLTQQLVKNLYPRRNYWVLSVPINKFREMILAQRLEEIYDKAQLIALYLNTVSFGENTYGIESAAQRFYSISATQLTLEQSAVLIGMLKANHFYNPRIFPERSRARRNVVLAQMEKYAKISEEKFDSLSSLPLELKYKRITHHSGTAPYFREFLRQQLIEWCKTHENDEGEPYNLYTDGLKVYTTIDSRLQLYTEAAVQKQMSHLQKAFDENWRKTDPWKTKPSIFKNALRRTQRYKSLITHGLSEVEVIDAMKKPERMSVFTWDGEKEIEMSPYDSVQHYLKFLNAGVLAMDPLSGAIQAWVGGINHTFFQFDHVRESTKRQVGSTFKPLVYAAALEKGAKPCSFVSAEKTIYENPKHDRDDWAPENTETNYHLKYSMEGGLAFSVNTVAVHILENTGIDSTIAFAGRLGIKTKLPEVPSLALGSPSISVTEMVTAYSCFVNKGKTVAPYFITSITNSNGEVIEKFDAAESKEVMSEDNARILVQMLKRTVDEGTASSIRSVYKLPNDIAGKTGTTQSYADGWFIAMTPNLVVGAWVGADDPGIRFHSGALGSGATTALPIVANLFQQINEDASLSKISEARFEELPRNLSRKLNCDLYKEDSNFLDKLLGKQKKDSVRKFGEKKKSNLWRRLFNS